MGSPGCAVWDERFGSSSVHCKSVPAGNTSSGADCAAPVAIRPRTSVRNTDLLSMVASPLRAGTIDDEGRDLVESTGWSEIANKVLDCDQHQPTASDRRCATPRAHGTPHGLNTTKKQPSERTG